jgi:hypothetical protein
MIETMLIIHILSAAAWLGGGFLNLFLGPRMAKAGGPVTVAWIRVLIEAASRFFTTAGVLTLLSGIGLVLVNGDHSFTDPFVITGIVIVVVALGIVGAVLTPAAKAALAAAEGGDFPAAGANARKAAGSARIIVVLLVVAEIVMVFKI